MVFISDAITNPRAVVVEVLSRSYLNTAFAVWTVASGSGLFTGAVGAYILRLILFIHYIWTLVSCNEARVLATGQSKTDAGNNKQCNRHKGKLNVHFR